MRTGCSGVAAVLKHVRLTRIMYRPDARTKDLFLRRICEWWLWCSMKCGLLHGALLQVLPSTTGVNQGYSTRTGPLDTLYGLAGLDPRLACDERRQLKYVQFSGSVDSVFVTSSWTNLHQARTVYYGVEITDWNHSVDLFLDWTRVAMSWLWGLPRSFWPWLRISASLRASSWVVCVGSTLSDLTMLTYVQVPFFCYLCVDASSATFFLLIALKMCKMTWSDVTHWPLSIAFPRTQRLVQRDPRPIWLSGRSPVQPQATVELSLRVEKMVRNRGNPSRNKMRLRLQHLFRMSDSLPGKNLWLTIWSYVLWRKEATSIRWRSNNGWLTVVSSWIRSQRLHLTDCIMQVLMLL